MRRLACLIALLGLASPLCAQPKGGPLTPANALAALKVADGFQVELFAAEPMLINPTSIDVDHKGRVWVAEAVNYRRKNFNRPILRKEGDRIVVLIDAKGDGKATRRRPSTRAKRLYGPLGVCVAPYADGKGQKVFVCQSPDILVFEDKDGDLKADGPPKKFLTGFGGFDHDHGVHGLNIGPDGKLYFTVGDSGVNGLQVERRQGAEVAEQHHRRAEGHRLAVRHGRHEPRTDRPQLPQQLRVLRQQLRRGVAERQRRRRQPADAHLLRDARRQLRLRPARPRPDALARGATRHRPQDAAHRVRLARPASRSTKGTLLPKKYHGHAAALRRRPARGAVRSTRKPKGAGLRTRQGSCC